MNNKVKRTIKAVVLLCLAMFMLAGCARTPKPVNEIWSKELTEDQMEIVELLSSNRHEILLFDYKTEEGFRSVEFWLEVYEKGVLVSQPVGVITFRDEAKPADGQLAVIISKGDSFQWIFTMGEDGAKMTSSGESPRVREAFGNAYGPVSEKITITDGEEFVLYTSIYASDGIAHSDRQRYAKQPELLAEYPYAYIIKGKFSK
ncbi:MAG: hypothetical protein ACOX8S_06065 [Christensenellales bacterium]|jgi:hypothetical protein